MLLITLAAVLVFYIMGLTVNQLGIRNVRRDMQTALQTGTDEEVRESVLYALQSGMPGYGYVFSTSNCVYTGMPLKRYDFMLDLWRKYGNYS